MIVIGLTGGFGSGKSTVAETMGRLGATVINADLVGHEAYLPHQNVWQEVVDTFGQDILGANDEVDRRKLGGIVFGDPQAMQRLNQIVHPWMFQRMRQMLDELREQGTEVAVLEAAILIEANWLPLVDRVWVTTASEQNVIQRTMARNLTEEQVRARIAAQMPSQERERYGDVVIDTNGTVEEAHQKIEELWLKLVASQQPSEAERRG